MSIYDTIGATLFWAPWLGLLALVAPLLLLAWGWRIYPTTRWIWVLLPLCGLSLFMIATPLFIYFMVVFDLLALSLVVLDLLTITGASRLRVERSMLKSGSLGATHDVTLLLDNLGARTQWIEIKDDLPESMLATPESLSLVLGPNQQAELQYKLRPSRRGAFSFESVYLRLSSRLRLWQRNVVRSCPGELLVYPDMKQIGEYALLARTNRLSLIGVRKTRKAGQDNNFERLRDYTQDDNYKHIDWRSTARRNKLTVKQFQTDQSQRIVFMLDCGRLMTNEYRGLTLLDYALNSILMLSYVALEQGDSVGMLCFSDKIESYVPMRGGLSQMNRILHAGFNRFPTLTQTNFDQAFLHFSRNCRRRSMVVLISNVIDDVSAAQITGYLTTLQAKHLPVLALLRDRAVFDSADNPDLDEEVLYRSAAAAQLLLWRREVLQRLENTGVLNVDTFPDTLTTPLINRYLEAKAKHML
jgi:uncharacterized protein (DUF58 family)